METIYPIDPGWVLISSACNVMQGYYSRVTALPAGSGCLLKTTTVLKGQLQESTVLVESASIVKQSGTHKDEWSIVSSDLLLGSKLA